MRSLKTIIESILFSILVCTILIVLGAPAQSVILGGFTVVMVTVGRSLYDRYTRRISQRMNPL